MPNLDTHAGIDWTACELIEQVPGKVSGRPIVRGTRIMPDGIVNSYDMGESMDEICEDWPALSVAQIKRLIRIRPHLSSATQSMKVLLDKNLAHRLRKNLGAHDVFTVSYKGWARLKNGELLRVAETERHGSHFNW